MDTPSFSRVRDLLRYARPARWTAILTGMSTAVLFALLILLLAMFVDLLATRGRIPTFTQLPVRDQESAAREWSALPEEDRARALRQLGYGEQRNSPEYQALLGGEGKDPTPIASRASAEDYKAWAAKRKYDGDPVALAAMEHEIRWRAYVWHLLDRRVGDEAARSYQPAVDPNAPVVAVNDERRAHGILGLVVRQRNTVWGRSAGALASVAGWTWRGEDPNRNYLTGLLLIGLGLALLRTICMVLMNDAAARATLEVVTRLRRSIYHHAARQGSMSLNGESVEEAGGLFTRQVERVHEALLHALTHSYRYAVFFPLMLLIAMLTHFWLSIAFIMFALLVWALSGQMTGSVRRRSRTATRVAGNRLELLLESLRHMRLVKSYLMELFNQSRVERQLADYGKAHLLRTRGDGVIKPLVSGVAGMAGITLLFLAGCVVLNEGLSLAGLVVLSVAFLSLYYPVRSRMHGRRIARHGRDAAAEIFEFLDRRGDLVTYPDADFLPGVSRGLEFAEVSLREPDTGRLLLNKVSFKVRADQRVGIVGSSVEEQIALVSLIPRFLDPNDGEIKIDGRNLKWVTPDSLRAQIGLVLQDSLVFNDTVANNIGCGEPSYSLPQIIEAAKLSHAHQFIQRLPYGYETPIGELGHSLSPGEQFRVALARAILRDPALFIIEEPADHLDEDTKDLVDDTLARVLPGKTVIYLPHRMSTLRECDKIYLLHEGRIIASGEHRELMSDNELYRHLYYLEFNPFAEATA
jgi:ABC-type multidrug transport system fused ATPase/permease subunit